MKAQYCTKDWYKSSSHQVGYIHHSTGMFIWHWSASHWGYVKFGDKSLNKYLNQDRSWSKIVRLPTPESEEKSEDHQSELTSSSGRNECLQNFMATQWIVVERWRAGGWRMDDRLTPPSIEPRSASHKCKYPVFKPLNVPLEFKRLWVENKVEGQSNAM